MRIAESRLKRIIRNVIKENISSDEEKTNQVILEDPLSDEQEDIVWSVINYLSNDQPSPKYLLLVDWIKKYGQFYEDQVINGLLDSWEGDVFKALYAYNKSSKEALKVLKKRLKVIVESGHNHGN